MKRNKAMLLNFRLLYGAQDKPPPSVPTCGMCKQPLTRCKCKTNDLQK